jgi:hypothetical protein
MQGVVITSFADVAVNSIVPTTNIIVMVHIIKSNQNLVVYTYENSFDNSFL